MIRNRVRVYAFDLSDWFVWTFWLGLVFGYVAHVVND